MVMVSDELLADSVVDIESMLVGMVRRDLLHIAFPEASKRTVRALLRAGLDVSNVPMDANSLLRIRGIGPKSVSELIGSE